MKHFTLDTTDGFTQDDCDLMNAALDEYMARSDADESLIDSVKKNGAALINNNWQESGNTVSSLLKRSVGAPAKMQDGKRVNVYLSAESRAIAERIAGGNVSEGIRKALDAFPKPD